MAVSHGGRFGNIIESQLKKKRAQVYMSIALDLRNIVIALNELRIVLDFEIGVTHNIHSLLF